LSSAILYVAIVAIWAVVLIPRWLRRDSSERGSGVTATAEDTAEDTAAEVAEDTAADSAEVDEQPAPEPYARPRLRSRSQGPQVPQGPRVSQSVQAVQAAQGRGENGRRESGRRQEGNGDIRRDREHARVLSSRRRLLGLLVLIAIGSAALVITRMAAWWVLGPPSVMLLSYLVLLREASKADAERRELRYAGAAQEARVAVADQAVPAPLAPLAPRPVRVPDAEIIDISASRGPTGEGLYDQYADAKLRAVGD
jgi:membrane protein implicated in regulation of membrane protease activity